MREILRKILFRGKRIDTGEWAYGSFVVVEKLDHSECEYFIIEFGADGREYAVISETVGQYTGLCDKNGKKIFENDIVVGLGANPFVVEFVDNEYWCSFCIVERGLENGDCWMLNEFSTGKGYLRCEVIGNIHDNPELLEI